MLIDNSSNHEYFCHKYKTSNLIKENFNKTAKYYNQALSDKTFFDQKMKANAYYHGKEFLQKLLLILFFSNKFKYQLTLKKMETLKKIKIPRFSYDGKYLLKKGFKEGRKLGIILERLEKKWVDNDFALTSTEVENTIKQFQN